MPESMKPRTVNLCLTWSLRDMHVVACVTKYCFCWGYWTVFSSLFSATDTGCNQRWFTGIGSRLSLKCPIKGSLDFLVQNP